MTILQAALRMHFVKKILLHNYLIIHIVQIRRKRFFFISDDFCREIGRSEETRIFFLEAKMMSFCIIIMLMFCVYASIRYKNVKILSSIEYFCLGCDAIPQNNESLRASETCDPGWSDAHFVNMGCLYFVTEEMNIDDANEFCG